MKTLITTLLFLGSVSATLNAQEQTHAHTSHLDSLLTPYLEMKNALVNDDLTSARQALPPFVREVRENKEMNAHAEHSKKHSMHHGNMLKALTAAEEASTLAEFRAAFVDISREYLTAVKNQNYQHPSLFVQFCPMANNGEGARWLSTQDTVANPYYGQMMLKCGETVTQIE